MELLEYNFSNAKEILTSKNNLDVYSKIVDVVSSIPHFQFQGKSESKTKGSNRIDTCQSHINRYLEYKLSVYDNWELHPLLHDELGLAADFRKKHNAHHIQIEVQCGNNSRYYADMVKFQIAWFYDLSDVAILIVPTLDYSLRMGENICNYERIIGELSHIKKLIQLPILVVGFQPNKKTNMVDLTKTSYSEFNSGKTPKQIYNSIKSKNNFNLDRNIQYILSGGTDLSKLNESYPVDERLIPSL